MDRRNLVKILVILLDDGQLKQLIMKHFPEVGEDTVDILNRADLAEMLFEFSHPNPWIRS